MRRCRVAPSTTSNSAIRSSASTVPRRPLDRARMRLAVAGRAARVRQDHGVARRIDLRLVEQLILELPVRPAMDQQQHRMRPGAGRRHQPAVHRIAVGRGRGDLGHRTQAGCRGLGAEAVSFVSTPSRSAITSPALVASVTQATIDVAGAIVVGDAALPADQLARRAAVGRSTPGGRCRDRAWRRARRRADTSSGRVRPSSRSMVSAIGEARRRRRPRTGTRHRPTLRPRASFSSAPRSPIPTK